jgi:hypothetical protein
MSEEEVFNAALLNEPNNKKRGAFIRGLRWMEKHSEERNKQLRNIIEGQETRIHTYLCDKEQLQERVNMLAKELNYCVNVLASEGIYISKSVLRALESYHNESGKEGKG